MNIGKIIKDLSVTKCPKCDKDLSTCACFTEDEKLKIYTVKARKAMRL